MNSSFSPDLADLPSPDLNAISCSGILIKDPELLVREHGDLIVTAVLAIEGQLQHTAWGTWKRQTFFVDTWGTGTVAEQLSTMPVGSHLKISGALDYLYNPQGERPADRLVLAIRIKDAIEMTPPPR